MVELNILRGFIKQLCTFKYILKQYSNEDQREAIKRLQVILKLKQ